MLAVERELAVASISRKYKSANPNRAVVAKRAYARDGQERPIDAG